MKEILIGLVAGIVSGTGMGGGTVLILLLTALCGIEQHIAQATNLIFFIPTSIVAIITNSSLSFTGYLMCQKWPGCSACSTSASESAVIQLGHQLIILEP